jgi:hypothetical protein
MPVWGKLVGPQAIAFLPFKVEMIIPVVFISLGCLDSSLLLLTEHLRSKLSAKYPVYICS